MAVDLSRAVGWWEEWQLRILVLGSLFLQLVLFAGSMVRNLRIPMSRLCIWLAYLGADALAIYALATLFNRHKQPPGAGSSSALEVSGRLSSSSTSAASTQSRRTALRTTSCGGGTS